VRTPIDIALELDSFGFNVLPVRFREKAPSVPWKKYQTTRTTDKLDAWFRQSAASNFFIICGRCSCCVVLDIDSSLGEAWAEKYIGREILDKTTCVKTAKGHHYYFRIEEDQLVSSWSKHDDEADFDFRAENTGVVAPPSIHSTGIAYQWVRGPEVMEPVPEVLLVPLGENGNGNGNAAAGGPGRSHLAELLKNPPREGGRNEWLSRVAGHYAKVMEFDDAYRESVMAANSMLSPPLDQAEATKAANSIWEAEQQARSLSSNMPSDNNGWLIGRDERLWTTVVRKGADGNWEERIEPWSDFDLRALGIVITPTGRYYEVEVTRPGHGIQRDQLEHSVLGNSRSLNTWLAGHGCTVLPPAKEKYRAGSTASRLQRYLESQNPSRVIEIERLGWKEGIGFVTHEGVITKHGFSAHLEIAPKRELKTWVPVRYGFDGDVKETRDILAQVMTFHEEHVTAVYGSWLMSCLLKPFIEEKTGWFPFMIVEGPSETGKTNGFFAMMQQLVGNSEGAVVPTQAVLRDSLSAHNSTPMWVDDMTDPERILDKMRQAAMGGSESKKGQDNTLDERVKMVRPLVISGEGFPGLHGDRALIQRAIILDVPSPVERESLLPGRRGLSQWDDVQDLWMQYGRDLTRFAGHIVQMVLAHDSIVDKLPNLRSKRGRVGEKVAMLKVGTLVLQEILEADELMPRVDEWLENPEGVEEGDYPYLILEALPACLRDYTSRTAGLLPTSAMGAAPVFIDRSVMGQAVIWWNDQYLADWLAKRPMTPRQRDQSTYRALREQRKLIGVGGTGATKQTSTGPDGVRTKARYHYLDPDLTLVVLRKAQLEEVWKNDD